MIDINIFYNNGILNKNKIKRNWIKNNLESLYLNILEFENNLNIETIRYSQIIWHYINNKNEYPICKYCVKYNMRFDGITNGYKDGCSRSCAIQISRPMSNQTRKKNTMNRHGVEHTTQLESTKNRMKETNMIRYGFVHAVQNESIKSKIKSTNIKKYGVELPLQNLDIMNKMKENNIIKYGFDNPSKSESIKEKKIISSINKWGVEHHITNKEIKSKIKESNDNKFLNKIKVLYDDESIKYINGILTMYCKKCLNLFSINPNLLHQRYFKNKIEVCTNCKPIDTKISNGHNELIEFISRIGVNFKINDRKEIYPQELDIYLPEYKIGIEYNGLYWHSDLQKDKNYHLKKRKNCLEKGIELITIWEDDWLYKKNIIMSIILNRIGDSNISIGARRCEIKEVDSEKSKEFLNENHIQGWAVSKYRFGLFFEDELVSLITLSKGRISLGSNGDVYEIVRYCNKLNYNVIGGLSKLFKYFIKIKNPNTVISYCDLDMFKGSSYLKIGMLYSGESISYKWCDNNIRWNRWKFRKDKLIKEGFDKNMSEYQIMLSRGWYRCWSSGNSKYIYKKVD